MKQKFSITQRISAIIMIFAMFAPTLIFGADTKNKAKTISEDQKILHVLNRLGFGAKPGDVEKVKAIGLQKYIDEQLNAGSNDSRRSCGAVEKF